MLIVVYFMILRSEPKVLTDSSAVAEKSLPANTQVSDKHSSTVPPSQTDSHSSRAQFISLDKESREKNDSATGTISDLATLFGVGQGSGPIERDLSVVRVDITNLNDLRKNLSPQAYFKVMDFFYSQLLTCVETFQGEINHFDGQWALLAFGRILILDNHGQSAENAAQALPQLITEIEDLFSGDESLVDETYIPLEIKVAFASGTVMAGTLGKDMRQMFTMFGGPVDEVERANAN